VNGEIRTMKILVLGGAGAMGMVTARDLAESPEVSEVVVGDASLEKMEEVKRWAKSEKILTKLVDASSRSDMTKAMENVDAVANATPYHLNLHVMKAAMQAGKSLVDLGGVYYMTRRQLKLHQAAKRRKTTIVLGCGLAPGTTDILAKCGADRMSRVDEIHIRYGDRNLEPVKYKWAFRTVLEEYTRGPVVYQNGGFKRLLPFSGKQIVDFPEPLGERPCCFALYSGVATLPHTVGKGVKVVDCAMSYTDEDEPRIRVLTEMGLTSTKPIRIGEAAVSPREFLLRCAPPPDVKVKDVAGVLVEVKGEEQREQVSRTYTIVHGYQEEYGVSALAYLTGVPLSISSQMLARGDIKERGVLPSEQVVEPQPFVAQLARRGIKITETMKKTRVL